MIKSKMVVRPDRNCRWCMGSGMARNHTTDTNEPCVCIGRREPIEPPKDSAELTHQRRLAWQDADKRPDPKEARECGHGPRGPQD